MSTRLPHEFDRATERQVRIRLEDDDGPGGTTWFSRVTLQELVTVLAPIPHGGETYVLALQVPGGVAEYYRQQGRRQMQSEFRALINAARD